MTLIWKTLGNSLFILLILLFSGCSTTREFDSEAAKWMIPVNVAAAYFGSIALHEGGHAIPALAYGSDKVRVDVLPARDEEGVYHLGLTTYTARIGRISDTEFTVINTMGPTAQFIGHISARALLRSEKLPRLIQPTIAWFGLFNQIGYYFHALNGVFRNKHTDLGKEDIWISLVMLGGGLAIDVFDFFTEEKPENRLKVLFGEYFYEPALRENARLRLISQPQPGGGFLGLQVDW